MQRILPSAKLGRLVFKGQRKEASDSIPKESLGLKPGEWVEVKSLKEIFATLDNLSDTRHVSNQRPQLSTNLSSLVVGCRHKQVRIRLVP
jgi:hypothetical protein